jgi:hypothetical protein
VRLVTTTSAQPYDLGPLRNQFAEQAKVHPPRDWSPALLQAVNSLLEMYIGELGLQKSPASVLELVRET